MLATVAWQTGTEVAYALEGSCFIAGAAVQWLRDALGLIRSSSEIEALARSVPSSDGVVFVPALSGLGAPHWDPDARGLLCGLTRGSSAGHIARATLESMAFQTRDVVEAMEKDSGVKLKELRVDGGATASDLAMQFQADILGTKVQRPVVAETTALGAAYLAGLATGFWKNETDVTKNWALDKEYKPKMSPADRAKRVSAWQEAVSRSKSWVKP